MYALLEPCMRELVYVRVCLDEFLRLLFLVSVVVLRICVDQVVEFGLAGAWSGGVSVSGVLCQLVRTL
jgi:hypothetical protein